MRTLLKRVCLGISLAVMAGIMTFGVQEAMAANRAHGLQVCENYPMCSSQDECNDCCVFLQHSSGFCTMAGACLCS
jgi:hypothetical protein